MISLFHKYKNYKVQSARRPHPRGQYCNGTSSPNIRYKYY